MQLELLIFRRRHAHRVGLACAAVVLGFREKRGVHYPRELGDGVWLSERVWEASQSLPGVETGEGSGGVGTMGMTYSWRSGRGSARMRRLMHSAGWELDRQ